MALRSAESGRSLPRLEKEGMRHPPNTRTLAMGAGRVNTFPRKLAALVEDVKIGAITPKGGQPPNVPGDLVARRSVGYVRAGGVCRSNNGETKASTVVGATP